jgi:hypothetical protein
MQKKEINCKGEMYKHKRQRAERECSLVIKYTCQRNTCTNKKQGNERKFQLKFYDSFHNNPSLERSLSQLNAVHTLATEFL